MNTLPQRPFAVFDIDGTLFRWQLFHEMVFELAKAGVLPHDTEERMLLAQNQWRNRAHSDSFREYEMQVIRVIEDHLAGLPVEAFTKTAQVILQRSGNQLYTYTRELLADLRKRGYLLFAISGSFEEIVTPFARQHGFDDWAASICYHKDGHYTGRTNWIYNRKAATLKTMIAKHGATYASSVGVGDTKNDMDILEIVEQPIAFNPNLELFEAAKQRGWHIVVERKDVAYELQPHGDKYTLVTA